MTLGDRLSTEGHRLADGWSCTGSPATIERVDGQRSTAQFTGPEGERVFVVTHRPADDPERAVVICPAVHAEAVRLQQAELALARMLADSGALVARFHYRGMGNSDREPESLAFDRMVEDASTVARLVKAQAPNTPISFVGVRLGGLAALASAARIPGAGVVLWAPPVDLDRYYAEVFRARMIGLVKRGLRGDTGKAMLDAFESDGVLDVVGNPVGWPLYASTRHLDLGVLVGSVEARRVLAIQMSVKQEIRTDLDDVARRFPEMSVQSVPYDEAWWFGATGRGVEVAADGAGLSAVAPTLAFILGRER